MMTVKIEMSFDMEHGSEQMMTIPFNARVRFSRDAKGRLYFAYEIYGTMWRPRVQDIHRFANIYGVKSYKAISEYLKGETLVLIRTTF
jgi:hypothetical protein